MKSLACRPLRISRRICLPCRANTRGQRAATNTKGWDLFHSAALDLHDGHVIARVERRRRSIEFIALLKDLDSYYPPECNIRLVLDNHSAHLSKETQDYLAARPNRFHYVLTPTHGSWLNLAETPRENGPHLPSPHPRGFLG
jgi:hypothetical protein